MNGCTREVALGKNRAGKGAVLAGPQGENAKCPGPRKDPCKNHAEHELSQNCVCIDLTSVLGQHA